MISDLRFALRTFARAPGFTLVAILTLALGIGATTAIFSVVNAVLLKPLPYATADRLVVGRSSLPDIRDVIVANHSFDEVAVWASNLYTLEIRGDSRQVRAALVSPNLLTMLGVTPVIGRTFTPGDDRTDSVILGYALWQSAFAGDPGVLGRSIVLTGTPHTVIGVTPAWFRFPSSEFALWTPLGSAMAKTPAQTENRTLRIFSMLARLGPGVTIAQAQQELTSIGARLAAEYPQTNADVRITLQSLTERLVGNVRASLLLLLGAVGLLLLIACANVANLLLARTTVRGRELSIRTALGATRARLVRQLAIEHLVLATGGGSVGVIVAMWGVDVMPALLDSWLPRADGIRVDPTVLLFALGSTIVTALFFGIAPAMHAVTDAQDGLRESSRAASATPRGRRLRQGIVVIEIALAVIVVVGAGLLARSFVALTARDPGFNPLNLLTFNLPLIEERDDQARNRAVDVVIARIGQLPGVAAVGASSGFPIVTAQRGTRFAVEGRTLTPAEDNAYFMAATPDYFQALAAPVSRGRSFTPSDGPATAPVAIVNRAFADAMFAGQDAIGRRIRLVNPEQSDSWRTVVGVVGNLYYQGADSDAAPTIYTPFAQTPFLWAYVMVRTSGEPGALAQTIRTVVPSISARLTAVNIRPMQDVVRESVAQPRLTMRLTALFGLLALLLAGGGIYGVVSYSVAQRTREIGIRRALGAGVGDVVRLVVGEGAILAAAGVLAGLAGAAALMQWTATLLFGVTTRDPITYGAVGLILMTIAGLASWLPARRALGVEPVVALRQE